MERNLVVGIFLFVTAFVILVPVVVQIRGGRFGWREVWGIFVLIAGFCIVGSAFAFASGDTQRWLSLLGLGAVLFGLFAQHRGQNRTDER